MTGSILSGSSYVDFGDRISSGIVGKDHPILGKLSEFVPHFFEAQAANAFAFRKVLRSD